MLSALRRHSAVLFFELDTIGYMLWRTQRQSTKVSLLQAILKANHMHVLFGMVLH